MGIKPVKMVAGGQSFYHLKPQCSPRQIRRHGMAQEETVQYGTDSVVWHDRAPNSVKLTSYLSPIRILATQQQEMAAVLQVVTVWAVAGMHE